MVTACFGIITQRGIKFALLILQILLLNPLKGETMLNKQRRRILYFSLTLVHLSIPVFGNTITNSPSPDFLDFQQKFYDKISLSTVSSFVRTPSLSLKEEIILLARGGGGGGGGNGGGGDGGGGNGGGGNGGDGNGGDGAGGDGNGPDVGSGPGDGSGTGTGTHEPGTGYGNGPGNGTHEPGTGYGNGPGNGTHEPGTGYGQGEPTV